MSPRLFRPQELYEVCQRTNRGELSFDLNNIDQIEEITGVLGEAQRIYGVPIFAFQFMSNHYHGLFAAPSAQVFGSFLGFFHAGVARIVNRDRAVPGVVWGGRPHIMPVAKEESALLGRLRYIMGQGVKANLAKHPCQFPAPSSTDWLTAGIPILGKYYHRTLECRDKRLKAGPKPHEEYSAVREVAISKLPGYEHRDWADLHLQFMGIADEIAGAELAELIADGHPAKLQNIDLFQAAHHHPRETADSLEPAPPPQEHDSDSETPSPSESADAPLCQIPAAPAEIPVSGTAAATGTAAKPESIPNPCRSADQAKVQLPSRRDDNTGHLQQRPKPKKVRRKGASKQPKIHAATKAAQDRYADELAEFCKAHAAARLGLARNLRRVVQGKRWRTVRIPDHALFGGGLGGAARQ